MASRKTGCEIISFGFSNFFSGSNLDHVLWIMPFKWRLLSPILVIKGYNLLWILQILLTVGLSYSVIRAVGRSERGGGQPP